jgi:hypothetical protein
MPGKDLKFITENCRYTGRPADNCEWRDDEYCQYPEQRRISPEELVKRTKNKQPKCYLIQKA